MTPLFLDFPNCCTRSAMGTRLSGSTGPEHPHGFSRFNRNFSAWFSRLKSSVFSRVNLKLCGYSCWIQFSPVATDNRVPIRVHNINHGLIFLLIELFFMTVFKSTFSKFQKYFYAARFTYYKM